MTSSVKIWLYVLIAYSLFISNAAELIYTKPDYEATKDLMLNIGWFLTAGFFLLTIKKWYIALWFGLCLCDVADSLYTLFDWKNGKVHIMIIAFIVMISYIYLKLKKNGITGITKKWLAAFYYPH